MSAPAHIARENGKKGGRPKGKLAKSTLEALEVKQLYVTKAREHALPILEALVKKALKGDVPAIREFNDRAYGKAPQAITGADGEALKILFDNTFKNGSSNTAQ